MQRGFSTLEMMIAMAIMVISLSAVIQVSFSNQGMLIGGQTNAEAMNVAQEILEEQQQLARKDFRLVQATSSTKDIYTNSVSVTPWEGDPYASKKITATVSWFDQYHISRSVVLATVLSNFMNAVGGDTCGALEGNWSAPQTSNYTLDNVGAAGLLSIAGAFNVGGLDAYRGILYIGSSRTSAATLPSFFVFDVSNQALKPVLKGSIDNVATSIEGLNAVVAGNTTNTGHSYVYGTNAHGANLDICREAANCSQLQIFDVSDVNSPTLAYSFKLSTSTIDLPSDRPVHGPPYVNGTNSSQAVGKSIFYKDGYVYLGLTKTLFGPEFIIIDVHNPLNPIPISGYAVGAGVESIYVRGKYVYLATDDTTRDLIVLSIANPLSPTVASTIDLPNIGWGNTLYAVGDTLYFGKTYAGSGKPEFYSFNIANPSGGLPQLSALDVGSSVAAIITRDATGFVLTSTSRELKILNLKTGTPIAASIPMLGDGATLDCERNSLYAGSNNGSNGYISVVTAL